MSAIASAWKRLPWWVEPMAVVLVLSFFGLYSFAIIALFPGTFQQFVSPFYSPEVPLPGWLPAFVTAPMLVLWIPLGFRATCYYYRKAYYRAFWLSPPACAVAEPHRRYTGENRFPLVLQNAHRWFWYAAVAVGLVLTFDVVLAFRPAEGEAPGIHMGLGTVLMAINVALIWLYTLSCHSCRHIVGGRLLHFSKHPISYRLWSLVSKLNADHGRYEWYSLFSVALVDLYIWMLAANVFEDPRFF